MIFSLQSTTLSDYSTNFTSFYCDSKLDVFTVITTKEQPGGIYRILQNPCNMLQPRLPYMEVNYTD